MLPSEGEKGETTGRRLLDRLSDAVSPFGPVGAYSIISLQWGQPKWTPIAPASGASVEQHGGCSYSSLPHGPML